MSGRWVSMEGGGRQRELEEEEEREGDREKMLVVLTV